MLLRAHRLVLWAFAKSLPMLNWAFLSIGLSGAIGTAAGLLPPYSDSWWAKITTILLWLLFAREGYDPLSEEQSS